jgi:hypothetical protein
MSAFVVRSHLTHDRLVSLFLFAIQKDQKSCRMGMPAQFEFFFGPRVRVCPPYNKLAVAVVNAGDHLTYCALLLVLFHSRRTQDIPGPAIQHPS